MKITNKNVGEGREHCSAWKKKEGKYKNPTKFRLFLKTMTSNSCLQELH